ncbi:MAG TPA: aminodeoxychorismate synthase component I [Thermodesulfobacteriota bacterium]|nr:aminodeoxychorismate synthase component I [Thermodesulfobacteriota bacterium]
MTFPCSALFLDSGGGWTQESTNSFTLLKKPAFSLCLKGGIVSVSLPGRELNLSHDPLALLESYLREGYYAAGYFSYEFSRFTEEGFIPIRKKDGESFPDIYFLFFKEEDVISGRIEDLRHLLQTPFQSPSPLEKRSIDSPGRLHSHMSRNEDVRMFEKVKHYIGSGDVYQVNISQRFTVPLELSPLSYFLKLYNVQPVPFGCYMDFGEFQIVSGSMELFLRKWGRKLTTKPIKGTRKRGITGEGDAILRAELLSSEKERAENLMIVDLMRNDLGRICKYGTVKVNRLFDVESYSTIHQMASEVEGYLHNGIKVADIIRSTFPPGSVTGAPKKRTLEIINELEPHLRGPYCGCLGVFSPHGDFTLSVAIRILVAKEDKGTFWVGGGIVWDSDPEKEYEETLIKARAIKRALGLLG